jgi:hypothetical protein
MKKLWRSGMIDKKVLREREQAEYVNRLERTILELSKPDIDDLINDTVDKPLTPAEFVKKWGDYDAIKQGDNVTLEFGEGQSFVRLKDSINDTYSRWLKNRKPYDSDIKFEKNTLNEIRKTKGFKEK